MVICHIWDAEYPWDVRVEKISNGLTKHGHDVHILARNRDSRPLEERLPEGTVHRLAPLTWGGRRLSALSMFPAFFNPRWIRMISRTIRKTGARILICRDLPLAPTAWWVARRHSIPVVFDMAEDYPAMIRAWWTYGRPRASDWLVRNPSWAAALERWVVRRVDHVLVVVEESKDRIVRLGVPPARVTVVSNTPPVSRVQGVGRRVRDRSGPVRLVYLGNFDTTFRGIGTLLEGMAQVRLGSPPLSLTLVGDGAERQQLEALATRLGLTDAVAFRGRVPNERALAELSQCDIGIIPHIAVAHSDTTIPNKLFDYMAAGLAVVGSDARPLARIIRTSGCGLVFRSGDATDLARALERMRNPEERAAFADAGIRAIRQEFHWERDEARLLVALDRVAVGPPSTGSHE